MDHQQESTAPDLTPLQADGDQEIRSFEQPKFLPNWDAAHMCNSPGDASHYLKRSKGRADSKAPTTYRAWIVDHQIGLSLSLLALLFLTHYWFPPARRRTTAFFQLSYYHPDTNLYHQGPQDFYYVATWIVIFTGLRAAVMTHVLLPLADMAGLKKTKTKLRFAEQAWLLMYYAVFWTVGMYLFTTSKYWLNLKELWTDFPARYMTALMKWYYHAQLAFWLQQIFVVNIEERRKDHWQMFTHHIVTCLLILTSLGYNQMRVGNVILCLMDVVDLVFPTAKILKYCGWQKTCDVFFGIFVVSWVVARHVLYMLVCKSIYYDTPVVMTYGTYDTRTGIRVSNESNNEVLRNLAQPYLDPDGLVGYNPKMKYAFLVPLLFLQGITLMWFVMICRVVWSVLKGAPADDSRSDDEAEEDIEELADEKGTESRSQQAVKAAVEKTPATAQPVSIKPIEIEDPPQEQYVGVEGLHLKRRGASPQVANRSRKGGTSSSSAFAGLSERKKILDRIGCDTKA